MVRTAEQEHRWGRERSLVLHHCETNQWSHVRKKVLLHVASFDSLEFGLLHSFRTHPTVNIYDGDRVRGGLGLATYVCLLGLRMDRTGRDGTE